MTSLDLPSAEDPGLMRRVILGLTGLLWLPCLIGPALAWWDEPDPSRRWLGAFGIVVLAVGYTYCLYRAAATSQATSGRLVAVFLAVALLSIPLVAPLGPPDRHTWAWIGGATAGYLPLVIGRSWGVARWPIEFGLVILGTLAVGAWTGGSLLVHGVIAVSIGLTVLATAVLPLWLWTLLEQARAGREARARLAVSEERLRFARDVHDVLGHQLTVIALKAELAARLAGVDPERATREAYDAQHLAAAALSEVRKAVEGYRAVDLGDQVDAFASVLREAGIRPEVDGAALDGLPGEVSTQLALVLREACTNVLRHSSATWCKIGVSRNATEVRMTITNDGARRGSADPGYGLRGAAERLAAAGGKLRVDSRNGRFELGVEIPVG
ncbi:sensor histidine kinase [Kribbella deserti]|uniref:Sensor histidine kinase n=1 Tax=Kribbella deserti TaxID=1926257 RepID=A0ABV6QQZ9_9ACTN